MTDRKLSDSGEDAHREATKEEFREFGGFPGYCSICGNHDLLQKHHVSYSEGEIKMVCPDCHYRIHHSRGFHDHLNPFARQG